MDHPYPKEEAMPTGVFPVPRSPSPHGAHVPLSLVLRTWRRRAQLDDALAAGADPTSSPELELRAAQLESWAGRSRLANQIVKRLGKAHAPNLGPFTGAADRRNAQIREYADNLRALVARLRDGEPVDVQGAAMAARLVDDRDGPLRRGDADSLGSALLSVRLALDRSGSTPRDLSRAA